jgi:hypothetical protein
MWTTEWRKEEEETIKFVPPFQQTSGMWLAPRFQFKIFQWPKMLALAI